MSVFLPLVQDRYTATDWQETDLKHLLPLDSSANFSEMGCYKTTTGLWLAERKTTRVEKPLVLIVTTKAGKGTYFDAIPKSMDREWRIYNVNTKGATRRVSGFELEVDVDDLIGECEDPQYPTFFIAHYHTFVNSAPIKMLLERVLWDGVIVDEAHRMKNRKTQWTRNIKRLQLAEGGFKHIMTGTGFINAPDEMWSPLNFLDRKKYSSYWNFRRTFCLEASIGGFDKVIGINPQNADAFRQMRKNLGPRRMMQEVHSSIEAPIFTPRDVELNPTQRKMYNEIKKVLFTLDKKGEPIHSPNVLSQLSRLRQVCVATPELVREYYDPIQERRIQEIILTEPSSKLDSLMEILEDLPWDSENRPQVVVFSNFRGPLELLKVRLDKEKIPYLHMQQKHSDVQRYQLWHDIWPQKEHRVFLTTLQLGSESINLSSAQYGVFLDRSWSPKDNNQAVARLWRPGQTGAVEIININAIGTVDQRIEKTVNQKTSWFKALFADA